MDLKPLHQPTAHAVASVSLGKPLGAISSLGAPDRSSHSSVRHAKILVAPPCADARGRTRIKRGCEKKFLLEYVDCTKHCPVGSSTSSKPLNSGANSSRSLAFWGEPSPKTHLVEMNRWMSVGIDPTSCVAKMYDVPSCRLSRIRLSSFSPKASERYSCASSKITTLLNCPWTLLI